MKKMIALLTAIILLLPACSGVTVSGAGKELEDTIANITDADNKYVQMVKGGYRTDNPDLTYEEAFTAFFGTPRWKYFEGEDGQDVVEFTGDCNYLDVPVKARIQFVVDEDNGTFEAVYLAFNEVPQDALTLAAVITKAFEQVELSTGDGGANNSGDFYYAGICLTDLLGKTSDEVFAAFGSPTGGTPVTGELLYGGTVYWIYDDQIGLYFDNSTVSWIRVRSEAVTINGTALNRTYEEIYDEFGEPSYERHTEDEDEGSSGYYYMEYILGGFVVGFEIPDTSDIADSVTLSLYNDGISDEEYLETQPVLDERLCGRWRSFTGKAISFDEYGNVSASWRLWDYLDASPESVTWSASNGRLEICASFRFSYDYVIKQETLYSRPCETLTLGERSKIIYYRDDTGTGAITGTWSPYTAMLSGDMTLYEDGTGYKAFVNQNFTWYADDTTYTELHTQGRAYDYTVSGDRLTLFFSDGADIFTKVGS